LRENTDVQDEMIEGLKRKVKELLSHNEKLLKEKEKISSQAGNYISLF
jgi:hypothetical protein